MPTNVTSPAAGFGPLYNVQPGAVPEYPDPLELLKRMTGAAGTVPALGNLGALITGATQGQLLGQYERAVPGLQALYGTATGQIGSMLRGEVPPDVADAIQRSQAAAALRGGYAGSSLHGAGLSRSLGLTSLDLIGQGLGALGGLTSGAQQAFTVQPWNIGAQVPTVEDLYTPEASEEAAQSAYIQSLQAAGIVKETQKEMAPNPQVEAMKEQFLQRQQQRRGMGRVGPGLSSSYYSLS